MKAFQTSLLSKIHKFSSIKKPYSNNSHLIQRFLGGFYHITEYKATLSGNVDRHNGITVDVGHYSHFDQDTFRKSINESLDEWRKEKKTAVWLKVPIHLSHFITVAAECQFQFHHAEYDSSVLCLWLDESSPNMLPRFATHQVGVSGFVLDQISSEVLVVKEKKMKHPMWKFPGGVSDLGEDIGQTAEREVYEETGIKSEFQSVLCFRQQHNQPGAFGRSDFYFVCRMKPKTFDIQPCHREILDCRWMDVKELALDPDISNITRQMAQLARWGLDTGFQAIDLKSKRMASLYKGLDYLIYHTDLPDEYNYS